jgi:hypothetical protein
MTLASLAKLPEMLRHVPAGSALAGTIPSIAPLRGVEGEAAVDWQGRTIAEALAAVAALTGATVGMHGDVVFGAAFWRAFLEGGYQAGAWVIDSSFASRTV